MNDGETVYIAGESRTNMDNSITAIYHSFYIIFEVNTKSDEIVDVGCTHTVALTEKFVKSIFFHKNIYNTEEIVKEVKRRYHGSSQKAIIVAHKEALKQYDEVKAKYY